MEYLIGLVVVAFVLFGFYKAYKGITAPDVPVSGSGGWSDDPEDNAPVPPGQRKKVD